MKTVKTILTDPMAIFIGAVVVIAIIIALFSWGKPVSLNNYSDKDAVLNMLANDSTAVTLTQISEVEDYKGKTVQWVYYFENGDSAKDKVVCLEVKKGFLKYKPVKLMK